jgi:predicted O-methyltransferase YrrM
MKLDNEVIGCLSPVEGGLLGYFSSLCEPKNCIVNIGCYHGRSLDYIFKEAYCKVIAIDLKIKEELSLKYGNNHDARLIEGSSHDQGVIDSIPDNIELLFIDGDHSYDGCTADLNDYWNKVIPGGIMCVHDAFDTNGKLCEPEVAKAVGRFVDLHYDEFVPDNWNTSPVHRCDSMAIIQKRFE